MTIRSVIDKKLALLFVCSLVIWVFMFKGFFIGEFRLEHDAVPYFEHTIYFVDQFKKGVIPLWDHTREFGASNEFYLRRIGEFNPAYGFLALLRLVSVPSAPAYFIFLTAYFFLGLFGFYKISRALFNRTLPAFLAYLLLLFSSFSTILFRSFIILLFTPMIWFFYFGYCFLKEPKTHHLLGMTLCVMLLMTTYIPFYFLTIFLIGIILMAAVFYGNIPAVLYRVASFTRAHKVLSIVCVLALTMSLTPGYLFFLEGKDKQFTIDERHDRATVDNELAVAPQTTAVGGVPSSAWDQLVNRENRSIRLGTFYVPVVVLILLSLSLLTPLNRRMVVLYVWGFVLLLMGLYDATPLYAFLYNHVFFFKYMRNFQFFLWLVILPSLILIAVEQARLLAENHSTMTAKKGRTIFIILTHVVWAAAMAGAEQMSTMVTIALSLLALLALIWIPGSVFKNKTYWLCAALLLAVIIEPVDMFKDLHKNVKKKKQPLRYEQEEAGFKMAARADDVGNKYPLQGYMVNGPVDMYYVNRHTKDILTHVNFGRIDEYLKSPLLLYTQPWEPDTPVSWERYVTSYLDKTHFEVITQASENVRVVKHDANTLSLATRVEEQKFLVYLDGYHKDWQVTIDGRKAQLHKANLGFKGVWVPPGEHRVVFRFGHDWQYVVKYGMLLLFYGMSGAFIASCFFLLRKERV